jgi:GNAT superfamily N-acetyltransferase
VPWTVRPAVDADAERVGEVTVAGWRYAYPGFLSAERLASLDPAAVAASRREVIAAPDPAAVLVVEDARGVQGCCVVGQARDPERDDGATGQLASLYLNPPVIGTGAGRALHDAAVDHLNAAGFHRAILWIYTGNTPAFSFYAHHGWHPDGEPVHPPEWSAPAVRWARDLPARA